MITDTQIADAAGKMVDKKFALSDPSKGWDCLNSLRDFYKDLGFEFPDQFEDWTWGNYGEKWEKNMVKGSKVFGKFMRTLGRKVEVGEMRRGDLLICTGQELTSFPGIYLGNQNVLMVFGQCKNPGPKMIPFKFVEPFLAEIRRIVE